MSAHLLEAALLLLVGVVSGAVNAVAGGGGLLVFPSLLALGMPPLAANVTTAVSLGPGFAGAAFSQRRDLRGQRLVLTSLVVLLGTALGSFLLLVLPASAFETTVPILVALAAVLLALQERIKAWFASQDQRRGGGGAQQHWLMVLGLFLSATYGGYFGGARSVIVIAVLVVTVSDTLMRLNALKSWLGLVAAIVTIAIFSVGGPVEWLTVALLVPATVAGGFLGGKLARILPAQALRWTVAVVAALVAVGLVVT